MKTNAEMMQKKLANVCLSRAVVLFRFRVKIEAGHDAILQPLSEPF